MERKPQKIGLDNPVFNGRLRDPATNRQDTYIKKRPIVRVTRGQGINQPQQSTNLAQLQEVNPPTDAPAQSLESNTTSIDCREGAANPNTGKLSSSNHINNAANPKKFSKFLQPKYILQAMAVVVFIIGLSVSLRTEHVNQQATAKVTALSQQADNSDGDGSSGDIPSTKKPPTSAVRNYAVAPDLARYIQIPKLKVNARVLQIGVKTNGDLDSPRNVYDAGWYTGSAKPGQRGATVIDGHVSSWKTKGVFFGLNKLNAGDTITIVKGDNSKVNYRVVQKKTYKTESVDMQKVIQPINAAKSGLNLITCAGKVKSGTNDFTHRTVIFTEQI